MNLACPSPTNMVGIQPNGSRTIVLQKIDGMLLEANLTNTK